MMPYLLGLFHWDACRVSIFGVSPKGKLAKWINLYGKCMLCQVLSCMHTYSLPIHCAETVRNFGSVNGQWVPMRAFSHKKESANLHIACISHTIRSILQVFIFGIAPNLLTLLAPQCNNPNK